MELKNLIREGLISAVYPENCSARVAFEDRDGLVSAELPVLQSSCFKNKFYSLPDVGDKVICLFFPNASDGSGIILGSRFHDKNPPPVNNQNISLIHFDDGTDISYDRESHELRIDCVGNIKINGRRIDLNE